MDGPQRVGSGGQSVLRVWAALYLRFREQRREEITHKPSRRFRTSGRVDGVVVTRGCVRSFHTLDHLWQGPYRWSSVRRDIHNRYRCRRRNRFPLKLAGLNVHIKAQESMFSQKCVNRPQRPA
jgi:hypothetical protein